MKKYQLYIDGEFVDSQGNDFIDIINPSTEELLAQVPKGTVQDVKNAIDAANAAQEAWEETPGVKRGE